MERIPAHHTPKDDGLVEAYRCQYCGRWVYETSSCQQLNQVTDSRHCYYTNEVNWDKDYGFYYIAGRIHNLRKCERRAKRRAV